MLRKKYVWVPLLLLIWAAVMAWVARDLLQAGEYLRYFGTLGAELIIIVAVWATLRRSDRLRREREEDQIG